MQSQSDNNSWKDVFGVFFVKNVSDNCEQCPEGYDEGNLTDKNSDFVYKAVVPELIKVFDEVQFGHILYRYISFFKYYGAQCCANNYYSQEHEDR